MKRLFIPFNHKGVILLQTLLLFFIFIMLASSVITIRTLELTNQSWKLKALFRMDLEIEALIYYHQHHPKHHDAIYSKNHWITYWYDENTLTINFDGEYHYNLVFDVDDHGNLLNRSIQDD